MFINLQCGKYKIMEYFVNKILRLIIATSITFFASEYAQATVFTPNFTAPSFSGSQFTVDAAHNAYYNTNFGITVEHAYLYRDSRDTFDGIGVANGTVANIGQTNQSGKVNFLDTTDFVKIDYLAILNTTYQAFSSTGTLLSSFNATPGTGSFSLAGGVISYVTFTSSGGYGTISGLTYNYDGTTDGRNTDMNTVPEPASLALFALGALGIRSIKRKLIAQP